MNIENQEIQTKPDFADQRAAQAGNKLSAEGNAKFENSMSPEFQLRDNLVRDLTSNDPNKLWTAAYDYTHNSVPESERGAIENEALKIVAEKGKTINPEDLDRDIDFYEEY